MRHSTHTLTLLRQVADHLEMSVETVRTHIRAIYKKLHLHSAAEAVARALREKLT